MANGSVLVSSSWIDSAHCAGRVVIIEPHAAGHRMNYAKWVAKALLDRHNEVLLVTTEMAARSLAFADADSHVEGRWSVLTVADPMDGVVCQSANAFGLMRRHLLYWRMMRRLGRVLPESSLPTLVFIPYLDYCDKAVALLGSPFGSLPWSGLVMRLSFHYRDMGIEAPPSRRNGPERMLCERLLRDRHLTRLFTIDEPLALYVRQKWPRLSDRLTYVGDPQDLGKTMGRKEARAKLGLRDDQFVVLSYGSLTRRKGVFSLLDALHHPATPPTTVVLLAGMADNEVMALLASARCQTARQQGRLIAIPRFLDGVEEETVLRAADLVWLVYEGHYGSSGLLPLAAAAGVPIATCNEGLIGWYVASCGLGFVSNAHGPLCASSIPCRSTEGLSERLQRFAENRTTSAFADCIVRSFGANS